MRPSRSALGSFVAAIALGIAMVYLGAGLLFVVALALVEHRIALVPGSFGNVALTFVAFAVPAIAFGVALAVVAQKAAVATAVRASLVSAILVVAPQAGSGFSREFVIMVAAPLAALLLGPLVGILLAKAWRPTPPSSGQPKATL